MIGKTRTICTYGYQTIPVQVEVDILPGIIGMQIVGLGDNAIKESRDRIRSAICNSGFDFPVKHIVVNLAPNEKPKEGSISELAICVAILIASGQLPQDFFRDKVLMGSLSLDGKLQNPSSLLASVIFASQLGDAPSVVIPERSANDINFIPNLAIYPLQSLSDIRQLIQGNIYCKKARQIVIPAMQTDIDMSEIHGLCDAKKGLSYAAIGRHHCIMIGAPGTGKTMLARAYKSFPTPMRQNEILETTRIYSAARLIQNQLVYHRPFRTPHHTTSGIAMVGGGSRPMPGEVSLAHKGTLFLDELMEFQNSTLQALREPMEDHKITISRALGRQIFPADFQLLGATNPCRCGYLFSNTHKCSCRPQIIQNLYKKILGPFLDRISIEIETAEGTINSLDLKNTEKPTAWWKSQIQEAEKRMMHRNGHNSNASLSMEEIKQIYNRKISLKTIVREYTRNIPLSNRGLLNTLRLGVSIMDFNQTDTMKNEFLEEAFYYRVICHFKKVISETAA